MGVGKEKQWEALLFACLRAGWSSAWLNWCILQYLKQQQNSHKMHAVGKGWWGSGLFSFWSEMEHYVAQEYAEHYVVCLMGGKHPFLPKASLDLGIHFSIWVNIFFCFLLDKNKRLKTLRSEVTTSRTIANTPSQRSQARWGTSRCTDINTYLSAKHRQEESLARWNP